MAAFAGGFRAPFYRYWLSGFLAVLLLLTLPAVFAPPPRPQGPGTARTRPSSARHDLGEGLRWVWRHAAIRDVTIMAAVVGAMDAAWFAVFVLYVMKALHDWLT